MKTLWWAIASSFVGALFAGTAMSQVTLSSPIQQPDSMQQSASPADDSTGYTVADPAPVAAAAAPVSPSNPPLALPAINADIAPVAASPTEECPVAEEGPCKLFHSDWLDRQHLDIRGYVEAGYTSNPDWPLNGSNAPVGYNDQANQFVLNQFYLIAERVAKVENDGGFDYGYRADVMYGADRRFVQVIDFSSPLANYSPGWDSNWNDGNYLYGLAMPQLYGDLAYDKLLLRAGHFYAPHGYENPMPTENFFYSHTYAFLYGEPTTLTGACATYKVLDKLSVNAGIDTGWNVFTPINGQPNYFVGVNWTSPDDRINVAEEVFLGNNEFLPGYNSFRYLLNTVVNVKLGCKWHYALEANLASDSNGNIMFTSFDPLSFTFATAKWWGLTNYLFYDINDCWGLGIRYEHFESDTASLVYLNGPPFGQQVSTWNDVTLGLNWKPNKNVTLRSEVRWDWAANTGVAGNMPFGDGNSNSQFLWGNDVVVRF